MGGCNCHHKNYSLFNTELGKGEGSGHWEKHHAGKEKQWSVVNGVMGSVDKLAQEMPHNHETGSYKGEVHQHGGCQHEGHIHQNTPHTTKARGKHTHMRGKHRG